MALQQFPGFPEDYVGTDHGDASGLRNDASTHVLPSHLLHELRGHEGPVLAVRYNAAGTYCLTCGKDRTICLWNPNTGSRIKTYAGHGYEVRDAAISTDNNKFASCGGDKQVSVVHLSWPHTKGHGSAVTVLRVPG
jgi:mitogen-activated protein kinase organizer 1